MQFKKGGLNPTTKATVVEKAGVSNDPLFGTVQSQNAGQGIGQGRRMGGSGRGMGMGGGQVGGRGMGGCGGGGRSK